ncbi:MAG: glutaredoxin family protein [gamma proteobacterium symbiont of Bathyaustriella thionipta]|nr:glutaredoxin family protein [gamma proteobacterium symbiont of Bathyaustriella thionipta]
MVRKTTSSTKAAARSAKTLQVILYSSRNCPFCRQAKAWFKARKIAFREYDVQRDAKGRKDFKRLRGRGVPIILLGKLRLDGFEPARFERLWKKVQ